MRALSFSPLCLPTLFVAVFISSWVAQPSTARAAGVASQQPSLASVQKQIEAGDLTRALVAINQILVGQKKSGEAHLLKSTILFLQGDGEGGETNLRRALELDPGLRQGWLNLGGLELAMERYDKAKQAFETAQKLDPAAPDNALNLGVVHLLSGEVPTADRYFTRHLETAGALGEAHYLISTNYAMAGYGTRALDHLEKAIQYDERMRLNARTDHNFESLAEDPRYQTLLNRDGFTPPADHFKAAKAFEIPYDMHQGKLLGAVVDALRRMKVEFSPRIEVTPSWSIIWGDFRIKIANDSRNQGIVMVSAPQSRYSGQKWQSQTDILFKQIEWELAPKIPESALPKRKGN